MPARSRWTSTTLTAGAVISGACLVVAILLELLGRPRGAGQMTDVAAVARSVAALESWGWSALGVAVMIGTPAVALVATALEYAAAHDRRTAWTAVAVLGVLGISLAVALLR